MRPQSRAIRTDFALPARADARGDEWENETMMTITEILAREIRHGRPVEIMYEDCPTHADGSDPAGGWYIATQRETFCYYRTREDARAVVREAREQAGR